MVISLECKVNNLNVNINEYFDELEIERTKTKQIDDAEVWLPDDIDVLIK